MTGNQWKLEQIEKKSGVKDFLIFEKSPGEKGQRMKSITYKI